LTLLDQLAHLDQRILSLQQDQIDLEDHSLRRVLSHLEDLTALEDRTHLVVQETLPDRLVLRDQLVLDRRSHPYHQDFLMGLKGLLDQVVLSCPNRLQVLMFLQHRTSLVAQKLQLDLAALGLHLVQVGRLVLTDRCRQ